MIIKLFPKMTLKIKKILRKIDKKEIYAFVTGAVLVNSLLYFLADWEPDSGTFIVFAACVQLVIAAIAVAGVIYPGFFEELKEHQALKLEIKREFKKTRNCLLQDLNKEISSLLSIKKSFSKSEMDLTEENLDFDLIRERWGETIKLMNETVPITPESSYFSEIDDKADKYGVEIPDEISRIYYVLYPAYDFGCNLKRQEFRNEGLEGVDQFVTSLEAKVSLNKNFNPSLEERDIIKEDKLKLENLRAKAEKIIKSRVSLSKNFKLELEEL